LEENATVGFCSDACATTANSMTNPPAGSDDACIAINDSDATPACAAPIDDPMTGMTVWVCALACGMTATVDFGTCPSNLTCDQPDTTLNGFCLP